MLFMRNAPHKQILDKGDTAMASNQTSNYGLNQGEAEDRVIREEFNADNTKVDAALAGLAAQTAAKAEQTEVDGIKTQLAAKAAQSALDSLSSTVTTGLAKKYGTDNPAIKTGTYTGTGASSRSFTLGFRPTLVMLFRIDASASPSAYLSFLIGDASVQAGLNRNSVFIVATDMLEFSSTGFTYKAGVNVTTDLNLEGGQYRYFAFR